MKTINLNPNDVCCDICIRKATTRIILGTRRGYSCELHIDQVSKLVRETASYLDMWKKHSEVV